MQLLGGEPHFAAAVDIASDDSFAALREAVQARKTRREVYTSKSVAPPAAEGAPPKAP